MSVIKIDKNNFQSEVMNSEKPVLVDFWAPWCGPCRMVAPVVEEIAGERSDIKVCKVNEYPDFDGNKKWKDCQTGYGRKTQECNSCHAVIFPAGSGSMTL